jgi:hypothetical protein
MRVEVDQSVRGLTIVERRPPWRDDGGEWTRQEIARLGYRYLDVAILLEEIEADPTCIFWG